MKNFFSRIQPYLRILLPLILIYFIGQFVVRDWDNLRGIVGDISWKWIVLSLIFYFLGIFAIGWNWQAVLKVLGAECSTFISFKSFYYSMLIKYVPGRIWGATSRVVLVRPAGVPEGTAILGIIMESLLLMCSAAAVGLLVIGQLAKMPFEIRALVMAAPLILLLMHPLLIHRGVRLMATQFPNHVVELSRVPDYSTIAILFMRYCLVWIFQGLGFWFALKALVEVPGDFFLVGVGGNTLAWLAGFVVIFTPAGLGVRELVLTRLSSGTIGEGPAAMTALVSRVLVILCEIAGALIIAAISICKTKRLNTNR